MQALWLHKYTKLKRKKWKSSPKNIIKSHRKIVKEEERKKDTPKQKKN